MLIGDVVHFAGAGREVVKFIPATLVIAEN